MKEPRPAAFMSGMLHDLLGVIGVGPFSAFLFRSLATSNQRVHVGVVVLAAAAALLSLHSARRLYLYADGR